MKTFPKIPRTIVILAALAGLGIMIYLTYIHYASAQSFCDLSAEVSCDVVTTSIYSEIFGLPVSILGLGYFGLLLVLSLWKKESKIYQNIFLLTAFVLVPSLYLTLTEILFIHSFCILCESSKAIMFIVLITTFIGTRGQIKNLGRTIAPILIAGLVVAGITFFVQNGTTVSADYSGLAQYMNDEGWVYYKSYTCSNCRRQEKLFGDAYKLLNSVECHPDGPGGDPQLCLDKEIDKTPTFILEKDGQEVMRLVGVQKIDELKSITNYQGE